MPNFNSIWDITPETAHPRARQLLDQSVVWDYGDEDSPLGNDTGADTFAAYLSFRAAQPTSEVNDFVHAQLEAHGFPEVEWDLTDADHLRELLTGNAGLLFIRRDDFIIGLAFAQFVLDGTLDPTIRRRAIAALRRQETDVVLSFRGGGEEVARKKQLAEFRRILELV
jgi:uncharacterized protein YfeS